MRRNQTDLVFTERFDELAAIAHRVAFRIIGDRHVAEDIAQEALARAYSHWPKVSAYANGWVARVAGNLAVDLVRRKRLPAPTEQTSHAPDTAVVLRMELQHALRTLPRRQREALILRYVADMAEAEVAKVLGIRPGTVKQHLHRGTEAMRSLLIEPNGG